MRLLRDHAERKQWLAEVGSSVAMERRNAKDRSNARIAEMEPDAKAKLIAKITAKNIDRRKRKQKNKAEVKMHKFQKVIVYYCNYPVAGGDPPTRLGGLRDYGRRD